MEHNAEILPFARQHILGVCGIHAARFPHSRSTMLGMRFLRKMYEWFLEHPVAFGVVAVRQEAVRGFAVGTTGGYSRAIFRYALPQIVLGIASRPWLLLTQKDRMFNLWRSHIRGLLPRYGVSRNAYPQEKQKKPSAALASIAVSESEQGRGIGRSLLEAFEGMARERGCYSMSLSVEADNSQARKAYEKAGWVVTSETPSKVHYKKQIR